MFPTSQIHILQIVIKNTTSGFFATSIMGPTEKVSGCKNFDFIHVLK